MRCGGGSTKVLADGWPRSSKAVTIHVLDFGLPDMILPTSYRQPKGQGRTIGIYLTLYTAAPVVYVV